MAHLNGLWLIDAPASALNNLGQAEGGRTDNVVGVKHIRTREGASPYVSAQAFRYWLRTTLETHVPEWKAAPMFREKKVAYTDGDPIKWWDDDLFGYEGGIEKGRREGSSEASPPRTRLQRISN